MLLEEMRRVVVSHERKAEWWRDRRDGLGCVWPSADHAEGARAYVNKHAAMYDALVARCKLVWACERKKPIARAPAPAPEASDIPIVTHHGLRTDSCYGLRTGRCLPDSLTDTLVLYGLVFASWFVSDTPD